MDVLNLAVQSMKTFNTHGYGVKFYLELSALEKENFSA